MPHSIARAASIAALATLLGVGFAGSSQLAAQTPLGPGPGKPTAEGQASKPRTQAAKREFTSPEQIEARIEYLHRTLKITPAQEKEWDQVMTVMRDNGKAMDDALAQRHEAWKTMTALDDLRSYEALSKAHADGMHKIVVAFEPLYMKMTDEQKRLADNEFRNYKQRSTASK
jgi:hypothetical protein